LFLIITSGLFAVIIIIMPLSPNRPLWAVPRLKLGCIHSYICVNSVCWVTRWTCVSDVPECDKKCAFSLLALLSRHGKKKPADVVF
jgi:hypothetical protein